MAHPLRTALILAALLPPVPALAQSAGAQRAAAQACRAEFRSLCNGVQSGEGRRAACLRERQDRLPSGCRQAIGAARTQPGGG
ncbi:hypothetical protein [Falsiroseomonas selenitidurans]|uniref:Cysteine rich repeat protein n=1 Tax=Falsiroseomonas selenitidurans TaxID=2716335 RepID=A0ABX1E804_9PROT|nr:hypothetical protein [Falsiroseomonas selenitidurans]NKC32880.1 hypothetical protein [Falsiroseomonas selenitidurans]